MNYHSVLRIRSLIAGLTAKRLESRNAVAILVYRVTTKGLKIFYDYEMRKFGAFIPPAATLGRNIKFVHSLFGVFISTHAVIGDGCIIYHHVTIGSVTDRDGKIFAPVIGENTIIGANATVVGKVLIGRNCRIGAGVVLANQTIPDNSTVISQKPRIISS